MKTRKVKVRKQCHCQHCGGNILVGQEAYKRNEGSVGNNMCKIQCIECQSYCPKGTDGKPHCLLVETKDGKEKLIIDKRDFQD